MTEKMCPNCEEEQCEVDSNLCENCDKCKTCYGTGVVEYQIAVDDTREVGCEDCGGGYDDDDRAYDEWKDSQLENE